MRLGGVLTTMLLLAAPLAAGAQGHGGAGMGAGRASFAPAHGGAVGGRVGAWGGAFHGTGFDHRGDGAHSHGFHNHFHDHGLAWGWGFPYWGWSDCGAYGEGCAWGDDSGPGAASDVYGYTGAPPPSEAACGAWLRRGDGAYVWTRRSCGDPTAADPPTQGAVASNECSDWVWRANLHRSVCKRPA